MKILGLLLMLLIVGGIGTAVYFTYNLIGPEWFALGVFFGGGLLLLLWLTKQSDSGGI